MRRQGELCPARPDDRPDSVSRSDDAPNYRPRVVMSERPFSEDDEPRRALSLERDPITPQLLAELVGSPDGDAAELELRAIYGDR